MFTLEYRPKKFNEMIGQKGIIKEMKTRSKDMEYPSVLLFEGNSGCGKTTLANIISALLVDPNPIVNEDGTRDPNLESPGVKAVFSGKYNRDVIFKDASAMSKEDVLALQQELSLAPRFDSKKVIIIDEAQNLGKVAKGAMLTLLEKQRKDVYLILCTMDIESFDKAVKSRCAHYKFNSPSVTEISEYLLDFTDKLGIDVTEENEEFFGKGIISIAENCEGSVRMAVQNFERCILGEFWKLEDIEREFGIISNDKLSNLIYKLFNKDCSVIQEIKNFGSKDFYYKMFKTISDAYLFQKTGYVDQEWKKGFAEKLSKYDLKRVLESFKDVEINGYFREDLFLFDLVNVFFGQVEKIVESVPVRPSRIPV